MADIDQLSQWTRQCPYILELVLGDERAAAEITVMQLLNHTAGLDWRLIVDTGDDALTDLVARLVAGSAASLLRTWRLLSQRVTGRVMPDGYQNGLQRGPRNLST